jgi:hypothetical protein
LGAFIIVGGTMVSSVELAGQSGTVSRAAARGASEPDADVVKAFIAARMAKNWNPPKTPWGDPDIQGIFTTKDEANTPLERPDEWAGRRMEDITPTEFAAAVRKRQEEAVERAPFAAGGEPEKGVAIAVPIHWFDNLTAKNSRPWFVIDPPDGKIPPLTLEAKARPAPAPLGLTGGARDSYTDRSLADRCIALTPLRTPIIHSNSHQILQTPDYVVFRYEAIHEARLIALDGRPHVSSKLRSHMGDSRGHWEGNTLVVETTNFHEAMNYRDASSKNLRLIERFTRIAPDKVEWTVTLDDPTTWTRPWTYSYPMTEDNTQLIHEFACHEGNYGLANLLSAGRAADRKAGEGSR